MTENIAYKHIRSGGVGYHQQDRGLIAVWGMEAVQFLDGLITNDMKTLADGDEMLAAFPNAQGRLLAVVRVRRSGEQFFFESEAATREKLFQNLFRFTFAGDLFVEDMSDKYRYFEIFGSDESRSLLDLRSEISNLRSEVSDNDATVADTATADAPGVLSFDSGRVNGVFVSAGLVDDYRDGLAKSGAVQIDDETYETLRIEAGVPKYGVDMDETTIVPELGLDRMISYNKGCYIGQEIIARIHFRGHVAKRLTGLVSEPGAISTGFSFGSELTTAEGKNAGRITSVTYSPKLQKTIALAYVRYEFLAAGTSLKSGDMSVEVMDLPFEV